MSSIDYHRLAQLPSDYITGKQEEAHEGTPWYLVNFLPIPVKLYIKRWNTLILLNALEARSQARVPPDSVQPEDVLHVFTSPEGKDGPDYEILRPVKLRMTNRVIRIGDVTYNNDASKWTSSQQDINSIRIHNRTTMPLGIYYNGGLIARVDGDDGMSYMAGSSNNVYVRNAGYGFRLGEELTFVFEYNKKKFTTVTLTDNFITDMFVGMITQQTQVPYADIFSYHV